MAFQRQATGPRTKVAGVVDAITSRDTQYGTMFSVEIGGKQYGFGKTNPSFGEGINVSFYASQNERGYWQADTRSVAIMGGDSPASPARVSLNAPANGPARTSRESMDEKRQRSITYLASRKDAIEFLKLAKETDLLPLAKTAKAGAGFDALTAVLNKVTAEFYSAAVDPAPTKVAEEKSDSTTDVVREAQADNVTWE